MGRHVWPDIEKLKRTDLVVTHTVKGRAVEAKVVAACERGCGCAQEMWFRIKWSAKGIITAVVPTDDKPMMVYPDFYLRAKGAQFELNLDEIRAERWQAAMPWLAGVK